METIVDWMGSVFSWLREGVSIVILIWLLIAVPMLIFRKTRPYAGMIFLYSSFFTGLSCWWFCFIVCYHLLGLTWLVIGCLLFGVGVVPLTFVGLMIKSFWTPGLGPWILEVFTALILALIPRMVGVWIIDRHEKRLSRQASAFPVS
jgi:NO-binding membrane sensor protein with MHYT domain